MAVMSSLKSVAISEKVLQGVLLGTLIIGHSWKLYLIFRNILMLRDMPDPPPELDINPVAYEKMQLITQYESERLLLVTIIELNVRVAKLVFNYFPYIWKLTGDYDLGKSLLTRSMWFAAVDNCVEVAVAMPFVFLSSLLTGMGNPLLVALDQIVEMAFRGLLAACATYGVIYITDDFGHSSILIGNLALNTAGILVMGFYYRYMMGLNYARLPDDESGKSVIALAKEVGYPADTIYVDVTSSEPNAYYSSAIFSRIIIITESLLSSLDAPQVTSVVAHELGHWKYCHPLYTYLSNMIEIVAMGYFWMFSYGSSKLMKVFQLDTDVHPFIPVYVSFYFIWPPIRDLIHGVFNLIRTEFEFVADDYACIMWSPKNLRSALVKMSLKIKAFPLLDGWFAAWFIGHPSILQRIRRIDDLMENE